MGSARKLGAVAAPADCGQTTSQTWEAKLRPLRIQWPRAAGIVSHRSSCRASYARLSYLPNDESERNQRLRQLITQHQRQIFSYIYAFVPRSNDAEDLLQETNLVICQKFDDFRDGTNFLAWACKIAHWRIRNSQQKFARAKVVFDQDVFEAVSATVMSMVPQIDARHEALAYCLQKLSPRDRELVVTRYGSREGVKEAAQKSGRGLHAAYKALSRIRKSLLDCVNREVARNTFS